MVEYYHRLARTLIAQPAAVPAALDLRVSDAARRRMHNALTDAGLSPSRTWSSARSRSACTTAR